MPSNRLPSDGTFTNLYNQMVDENNSGAHLAALRIPSDTGFSDMYDDIAGEIEQQLQSEQPGHFRQMLPNNQVDGSYLHPVGNVPDRPSTSASTDTYQQAQTLFRDFDGVHYAPSVHGIIQEASAGDPGTGQSSILKSLPRPDPRVPPPADGMVYYPAPVPRTLNLPQRLSVVPNATLQAKRKTQMLATLHADGRKSAPWLMDQSKKPNEDLRDARKSKARLSALPPQLRASLFFEHTGEGQEVEIKESAVSTLEDLLDASAHAPVGAFTDHPIVGHVGSAVYKRESAMKSTSALQDADTSKDKKRQSSFLGLHRFSMSSTNVLEQQKVKKKSSRSFSLGTKLDDSALNRNPDGGLGSEGSTPKPGSEDGTESNESGADDDSMSEEDEYIGPPTTLLAELQLRKAAQKSRNRTALTAFPNGMHSTLLELDAVAQIQRQKRNNARVTLAWEDPDYLQAAKDANGDDENVPLGMLYSGNGKVMAQMKEKGLADWDRPLGLIEQRERDDNEPLSRRRDRLKGIDPNRRRQLSPSKMVFGAPTVQINGEEARDSEEEGETLAERLKRLKGQKEADNGSKDGNTRPISEAFSAEMLSHFDSLDPGENKLKTSSSQDDNASGSEMRLQTSSVGVSDEEEETLGQRRARLLKASQSSQSNSATTPMGMQGGIPNAVRPTLQTSPNMANLLQSFPAGKSRQMSDNDLVSTLPQDSLLRRAEEKQATRQAEIRKGNVERSSSYTMNKPLVEFSNLPAAPDLRRQTVGGFRGGMYNTGSGATPGQNMYGYAYPGMAAMPESTKDNRRFRQHTI